jgi:mRNA interferase HigB
VVPVEQWVNRKSLHYVNFSPCLRPVNSHIIDMRIVALSTLRAFWEANPQAERALRTWYKAVLRSEWQTMADIRKSFNSADFRPNNRVIFDIGGNNWRIVAVVLLQRKVMYIRFIGSHAEYDRINVDTV